MPEKGGSSKLTIPHPPIAPHSRLPIRAGRPRLNVEMHPAVATILVVIARAPAPVIPRRVARVDNLHRDRGPAAHAVVVRVHAGGRELVALPARGPAVGLAGAVECAVEELLVDGGVVEACAAGPLPGGLPAVAGGAHPAVVLWGSLALARIRGGAGRGGEGELTDVDATPS